ncbi:ABC transporter substrate-binding protein [uncultured Pseudoalteromonas sp.]|uniref:ABC transporter substrate-binding protein n=1 Tax=uncultured Pseudoalteromonas sp. TaxID=114053 RepID=UPI0026029572|nr:ABC transporter substrate-binding protein [uncultured Pseudoalteromonas sp.]
MLFSLNAQAAEPKVDLKDPYKMVRTVSDNTFARITKDQPLIAKDKEHLRVIVEEELMPYIDYKYAALRVLGNHVSKVRAIEDKEEKAKAIKELQRFIDVFQKYLIDENFSQDLINKQTQIEEEQKHAHKIEFKRELNLIEKKILKKSLFLLITFSFFKHSKFSPFGIMVAFV